MNTRPKNRLVIVCAVLGLGLGGTSAWLARGPAAAPVQVVKLERVVIEGKRASAAQPIEHLPRVVIEGRRSDATVQMAAARRCEASQDC
ncbi:hypothetical protein HNP55_001240 [Paucibacter oligotrophus]|uniref:Uncharacterized protein n=1 Tax=Roseateles oligotrophus TaxID=1769250 RepID=A0A840L7T5_9BURK|nr:hypothetical protein [Roseateles oligotrophus]MBB4842725.1 hypothetical protein [Roseateles oligotrophus]